MPREFDGAAYDAWKTTDPRDAEYCRHGFYHGEQCDECPDTEDTRDPDRAHDEADHADFYED